MEVVEQEEQEQEEEQSDEGANGPEGRGLGRTPADQAGSDEKSDEEEEQAAEGAGAGAGCDPALQCEFCGRCGFEGVHGLKIHQARNQVSYPPVKVMILFTSVLHLSAFPSVFCLFHVHVDQHAPAICCCHGRLYCYCLESFSC